VLIPKANAPFDAREPLNFWIMKDVPFGTILQEKINIISCFWEVDEFNNILMLKGFPGFYLIFQSRDEILLCQRFVFAQVNFAYQVLFW
jgi:hypothetical protein